MTVPGIETVNSYVLATGNDLEIASRRVFSMSALGSNRRDVQITYYSSSCHHIHRLLGLGSIVSHGDDAGNVFE